MIDNPKIRELAESLANMARKDRAKTIAVVEMAYETGRVDGAIDALDRLLAAKQPKVLA